MKKLYDISKKYPILVGIVGFLVIYLSFMNIPVASEEFSYKVVVINILLTIACTGFIALISGDKILAYSSNKTAYGLLKGIPIVIVNALLIAGPVVFYAISGKTAVHGWPLKLIWVAVFCLSIGLFEETLFRALINEAILYQFRDKKGVFVAIALISGFLFGFVHVVGADVHNFVTFLQAFLKTVNGIFFGLVLLSVYWKTRNIIACSVLHGLVDFVTYIPIVVFVSESESEGYVLEGEAELGSLTVDTGAGMCVTYGIQLALTVIALLVMLKFIKSIDFKKIREEW